MTIYSHARQWLALLAFIMVGAAGCVERESAHLFRYGHSQSPASTRSESMRYFENELERRSNGRIQVENYFSGVLGNEREMMDMVATGVLQGTRGGLFADANPKYVVFMLPFLVENWQQALALVESEFADRINAGAKSNGFHIPAVGISQGFRAHTNSVRPIRTPDDFHGLKMRVPPQLVYVRTAEVFGASPQEMPASEIYGALRTGVLDGQDNPPANIWDYKLHEVQRYMTITHYATGPDPFIVDLNWYESLPDDLRHLFDVVAVDSIRYSDELNRAAELAMIEELATVLEINYVDGEDLKPFQELSEQVYEYFIDSGVVSADEIREAARVARGFAEVSQ